MYIREPVTLTEMYVDNESNINKHKLLLNANFQDYMDTMWQSGQLEIKAGKLKQRISSVASGVGMAVGAFGGPSGIALGFAIGNTVGKYFGNVASGRIYGTAIADMAEMAHDAKLRHSQLAASVAFNDKMGEAIDTLRASENKRMKDDLQGMSV